MTFVHIWKVWNTIPTAKGNIWEPVLAQPKEPDHSSVPGSILKTASTCHGLISGLTGSRGSVPPMLTARPPCGSHLCMAPALAAFHRAAWYVGGAERRARPPCAVFKEKLCLHVCQSQLICSWADIHPIRLSKEFTSQRRHLFTSGRPRLTWPTVSEKNKLHCQQKAAICGVVTISESWRMCVSQMDLRLPRLKSFRPICSLNLCHVTLCF